MAKTWDRPKGPLEVVDYGHDWSADLGTDTIASSIWTPVLAAGTANVSDSHTTTGTTILLSGGVDGQMAVWRNDIETNGGRTFDEAFVLKIVDPADIPATLSDLDTLKAKLAEARDARQQLALGNSVVLVQRGGVHGRRMQFNGDDPEALDAYILQLQRDIEMATNEANGCPRRRSVGFRW